MADKKEVILLIDNVSYAKFSGAVTILAAIAAFFYAISFIVISRNDPSLGNLLSSKMLMNLGILSIPVVVGLYRHLKDTNEPMAMLGLIFGIISAMGAAVHGGYDLANAINPPSVDLSTANLPNQIDPRGLLTFGFLAISLFIFSWLIQKGKVFPKSLGAIGAFSGLLLLVIYLGRLIVLTPTNPIILYPVLLNGFIVYPLWLLWLGWEMWKKGK